MSKDWTDHSKDTTADAYGKQTEKPDGTFKTPGQAAHGNRVYGPQWQDAGAKVITDEERQRQERQRRQ